MLVEEAAVIATHLVKAHHAGVLHFGLLHAFRRLVEASEVDPVGDLPVLVWHYLYVASKMESSSKIGSLSQTSYHICIPSSSLLGPPFELIGKRSIIDKRPDLVEPGISICDPHVAAIRAIFVGR